MNENRNIKCAPSGRNQSWTSIDWNKAEETVKKLQARIVKAQKESLLCRCHDSLSYPLISFLLT